jgi:hypothetical protein
MYISLYIIAFIWNIFRYGDYLMKYHVEIFYVFVKFLSVSFIRRIIRAICSVIDLILVTSVSTMALGSIQTNRKEYQESSWG